MINLITFKSLLKNNSKKGRVSGISFTQISCVLVFVTSVSACSTEQVCSELVCDSNKQLGVPEGVDITFENDLQQKSESTWVAFKYGKLHEDQVVTVLDNLDGGTDILIKSDNLKFDLGNIAKINQITVENPTSSGARDNSVTFKEDVIELEWSIEKESNVNLLESCQLATPTFQIEGDDYSTQVWFNVTNNKLLINTTTNLDIAKEGVGIKINNGTLESFTTNRDATSAYWAGDISTLIENNQSMGVVISGNELGKYQHEAVIDLDGLKEKYKGYLKCNSEAS